MFKEFWLSLPKSLKQFAVVLPNPGTCKDIDRKKTNFTNSGWIVISVFYNCSALARVRALTKSVQTARFPRGKIPRPELMSPAFSNTLLSEPSGAQKHSAASLFFAGTKILLQTGFTTRMLMIGPGLCPGRATWKKGYEQQKNDSVN